MRAGWRPPVGRRMPKSPLPAVAAGLPPVLDCALGIPLGFVTTVASRSIAKMISASEDASNRRSRAALIERPHRDAEFPRLVGEIGGDPRAGESDDADR